MRDSVMVAVVWESKSPDWWHGPELGSARSLTERADLLAARGPALGRPVVITNSQVVPTSRSCGCPTPAPCECALFMFDPRRQVILLLGGNKGGFRSTPLL